MPTAHPLPISKFSVFQQTCLVLLFCAGLGVAATGQTLTTLASFDGTDGANPYLAGLVQGSDGNLYGTTKSGGANGDGVVFQITPSGTLTAIHNFCSQPGCTDGSAPQAGLVQATDGNFYGTTTKFGGQNKAGTVFRITPSGTLTTLHSFSGPDGGFPSAALLQAIDGNLYGTTLSGGVNSGAGGTVFKITTSGTLTTLYSFSSLTLCTDGSGPQAALVQGTDGNFYGTTVAGGNNSNCASGSTCGTVFTLTPSGALTTLYNFCSQPNCADGGLPYAGLVQGTDGNFYGTTSFGGSGIASAGTVFKISSSGALTTLYSFCSQPN